MAAQDKCYNHPQVLATHGCERCQQLICDECCVTYSFHTFCIQCSEEVASREANTGPAATGQDLPAATPSPLNRRIDSPWIIIAIIVITVIIVAVEIYIMTR